MICVAAPEVPQIGSCTTGGADGPPLTEPPQADKPPSSVAPADVPASTIKARRAGEFGSAWPDVFDVARLPLVLSMVATDVSLPFAGVVNNRCYFGECSSSDLFS
jgi:hypothetical protein